VVFTDSKVWIVRRLVGRKRTTTSSTVVIIGTTCFDIKK